MTLIVGDRFDLPAPCSAVFLQEEEADLAISKTASEDVVFRGDIFTYTLDVTNNGPGDGSGVVVSDTLPDGVTYLSDNCGGSAAGQAWSATMGSLPSGQAQTCSVEVRVDEDAAGPLVNAAAVTSDAEDPDLANNADSALVEVAQEFSINFTTFIPQNNVPGLACLRTRPFVFRLTYFAGDDRTFGDGGGSYRTRQRVIVVTDQAADADGLKDGTIPKHNVGQTREYASNALQNGVLDAGDNDATLNDCSLLHRTATATNQSMQVEVSRLGADVVSVHLSRAALNPLLPAGTPAQCAIDWDLTLYLDTSGPVPQWGLSGVHDRFPAYEMYVNGSEVYTYDPGALSGSFFADLLNVSGRLCQPVPGQRVLEFGSLP